MKTIKILLLLLVVATSVSAQWLNKIVPKDSKVYVLGPTHVVVDAALDEFSKWGYWQLAKTKEEADFLIYIYVDKRTNQDYTYSAEFRDKNDKVVYITPGINSMMPNGGVVKLIRKCMIKKVGD